MPEHRAVRTPLLHDVPTGHAGFVDVHLPHIRSTEHILFYDQQHFPAFTTTFASPSRLTTAFFALALPHMLIHDKNLWLTSYET
jgi:hypothetical protein